MKSRCNLVVESPLKIANTLCCVGFPPGMMNIGRTLVSTKVEYAAFWKVRPMPLTAIRYAVIPLERKSVFLGWKLYVEHIHCVCRFMRPLTLGQINKSSVNQFASMSSGALGVLFDSLYAAIHKAISNHTAKRPRKFLTSKYSNINGKALLAVLSKNFEKVPRTIPKYSLQGTTQGRYLTGGVPPIRFSM